MSERLVRQIGCKPPKSIGAQPPDWWTGGKTSSAEAGPDAAGNLLSAFGKAARN